MKKVEMYFIEESGVGVKYFRDILEDYFSATDNLPKEVIDGDSVYKITIEKIGDTGHE